MAKKPKKPEGKPPEDKPDDAPPQKRKRGRPFGTKANEPTRVWMSKFLDALKLSPKISIAARHAGVHRMTVQKARALHPDFNQACLDALEEFRSQTLVDVQNKAIELAKDGNERMIEFVLKGFDPRRYDRSKSSVKITGNGEDGDGIQVETETERTINVIRVNLVSSHAEAEELKRRRLAKQQEIDGGDDAENGHGGNGNGKHGSNGNGNGKK